MALRLCLLGLVALMGFELPTGHDLDALGRQGSRWMSDRVADLRHFGNDVEQAFNGESRGEPAMGPTGTVDRVAEELAILRADVVFEGAMERLSFEFRADLAATEAISPVAEEAPPRLEVVAEPTPSISEPPEPTCFDRDLEAIDPAPVAMAVESGPPLDRLSSAMKLTREALSAWASLIPQVAEDGQVETR